MSLASDQLFYDTLVQSYVTTIGTSPSFLDGRSFATPLWLYRDSVYKVLVQSPDRDPVCIYANRAAQACYGYDWDEFQALPLRLTIAEQEPTGSRDRLMERVERNGAVENYSALRIGKSGLPFRIENAVVWQVVDAQGILLGIAAAFRWWSPVENATPQRPMLIGKAAAF